MTEPQIRPEALEMLEELASAKPTPSGTAWQLDRDVLEAVNAAYAQMDGRVTKKVIINSALRRALIVEAGA